MDMGRGCRRYLPPLPFIMQTIIKPTLALFSGESKRKIFKNIN
jgi:hypothetical protein